MYFIRSGVLAVAALLSFSGAALAQVSIQFISISNSPTLSGYVTSDLDVTTDTDWTCAAVLVELTSGTLYQNSYGTDTSPNPGLFPFVPALEFDTYMAGNGGSVGVLGAAGDIGGTTQQFDSARLDASWNNSQAGDVGVSNIGRFTLSAGATGTWKFGVMQADDDTIHVFSGTIVNGAFVQ